MVIYVYPQLLPEPYVIQLADLAPIVRNTLVGLQSKLMPPSAFLSPYAKYEAFNGYRYHFGDFVTRAVYAQEMNATVEQALGWLPEFDVRIDRVNGQLPYFTDRRSDILSLLGLREQSSIYATLDDFNNMVKSYGATLAVAFAPVSARAFSPADPHIPLAEQAMQRFSADHPEVKFLFPLISRWSPEKFGTANHISREYTFLSSMRLGQALDRLVHQPQSIGDYEPNYGSQGPLPTITVKITGMADPELRRAALAFYLYTSTLDPSYGALISRRVLDLLESEPPYRYMIADKQERVTSLQQRHIDIGVDTSKIEARPIDLSGMTYCDARPDTQWVQLSGIMNFTYKSPDADLTEPVRWPEQSNILIPTIIEDGVRKFDGYCPEPSLDITSGE